MKFQFDLAISYPSILETFRIGRASPRNRRLDPRNDYVRTSERCLWDRLLRTHTLRTPDILNSAANDGSALGMSVPERPELPSSAVLCCVRVLVEACAPDVQLRSHKNFPKDCRTRTDSHLGHDQSQIGFHCVGADVHTVRNLLAAQSL